MAVAQVSPAPSIKVKKARSPGIVPGAAPNGIRVAGLSLFIENATSIALVAPFGKCCTNV
jgi:hypothetical protein